MAIGPCNVKGCELRAISGDKCLKHGPKKNTIVKKMCNSVGCGKEVVYYGKCEDHRTQSRKKCEVEGCTTGAVSKGLCIKHGGGKRCKIPTCDKGAEKGGLCKSKYMIQSCEYD
jgi:hypothetical protein